MTEDEQMAGEMIAASRDVAPLDLLMRAVSRDGVDIATIERLAALHEAALDRAAAQEWRDAMARYQEACPPVPRRQTARIATRSGAAYTYSYADLGDIAAHVQPYLHREGLSYSWDIEQDRESVTAICTLRHSGGHSESSRVTMPITSPSPGMSAAHQVAGARTMACRLSLASVLGAATVDDDPDGSVADQSAPASAEQIASIRGAMRDLGVAVEEDDYRRFLRHLGIESLEDLPAERVGYAMSTLRTAAARRAQTETETEQP